METVATVRFTAIVGPTALDLVRCGLGGERARTYSAILATEMATERPASDQASQVAVWVLTPLTPGFCSLARSVTAPLYSTTVSPTLRKALRAITFWTDFVHASVM